MIDCVSFSTCRKLLGMPQNPARLHRTRMSHVIVNPLFGSDLGNMQMLVRTLP